MTNRHYYALSDWFTGPNPPDYAQGFSNGDEVVAFRTRAERDTWVKTTKLLKARALTRKEAQKIQDFSVDYRGMTAKRVYLYSVGSLGAAREIGKLVIQRSRSIY